MIITSFLAFVIVQSAQTKPRLALPDANTAVSVAEVLLGRRYGQAHIRAERPFTAKLNNGVWLVEGTLPGRALGGVASMKLRASDCQVLEMIHGK